MEANVLQFLNPKTPLTSTIFNLTRPSSTPPPPPHTQILSLRHHRSLRICATNTDSNSSNNNSSSSNNNSSSSDSPPPISPTDTAGIRFRRGSRKRAKIEQDGGIDGQPKKAATKKPAKDWEEMTIQEKAMELYVGEKGALFWLNKFAYASIYIMIGAWILFRFAGPALNLYQLDTPPLSPADVLKGS